MTDIYFVRHAESFGNLTRRVYGHFDGLVTPKGYLQIEALSKRFCDIHIDRVYSSDLTRTLETAKAIYEPKGLEVIKMPAFREIGFGVWEDRPWGELVSSYAEEYNAWGSNPLEFAVPGSETYRDVYRRAKAALDEVVSENDGKAIAIVSHGATIRMLMHGLRSGDDLTGVERAEWGDNTCVSHFRAEGAKYTEVFTNNNDHLRTLPGFDDGMSWVREGGGRNVWFKNAEYPEDADKIREYHRLGEGEVFGCGDIDFSRIDRRAKRSLRKDKESIVFGYLPEGEIGMIELDPTAKVYPMAGHISFLYLAPEYRRMRYGIQLVGHAMSRYKSLGKKHISVRVAETNTAARNFYGKYGFYEAFRENDGGIIQRVMILDI